MALGSRHLENYSENNSVHDLYLAELEFKRALQAMPDNVQAQRLYYITLQNLAAKFPGTWFDIFAENFHTLNPRLKELMAPPALLEYRFLEARQAPAEEKIAAVKRAIKQQPASSRSWIILSVLYEQEGQMYLALHSALIAKTIEPDAPTVLYRVGDLYSTIAEHKSCSTEWPELSKRAIKNIAKAAALEHDSYFFKEHLSRLYINLGLYPLALDVAKQAVDLESNPSTNEALGLALLHMGEHKRAQQIFKELTKDDNAAWLNLELSLTAIYENNWNRASEYSNKLSRHYPENLYDFLVSHWLTQINTKSNELPTPLHVSAKDQWQQEIKGYFRRETQRDRLIKKATNKCERTEAFFHTAMRYWLDGETQHAKDYLQRVLNERVYSYNEFLYAKALLASNLFDR